jgi:lysophospholipid acyltransferase (LPLAT)-like uncharacterized protein
MPTDRGSEGGPVLSTTAAGVLDASSENRTTEEGSPRKSRLISRSAASDIEELRGRVYGQADLSSYRFKERLMIYAADLLFYLLIRGIGATMKWEAHGMEHLDGIYASGHRAIFTFWHTCIFMGTWFWRKRGIVVMSSQSRDAEYTSRFIKRFGYGAARGSATRGSSRALAEMTECLSNGMDVAFTIDGPKGPAYVAKPGATTLARHSCQAILLFHVAVSRRWHLPSWDRLQIPKPFSRAAVFIAEPIYVSRDGNKDEITEKQELVQSRLDALKAEGDSWLSSH